MTTLTEKIWRPFLVGELFRLEQGKSKGLNHLEQDERGIPYLGATNRNNAVLAFVRPVEKLIQRGNCIAFIRNGEGSVGYSVYKQEDFIATSDITCGYADFLNKYVGLFMTTVADKVRGKYNFNYKRSDTRLKKERLMLPVNDDGSPDFVFMENYVRAVEEKILQRYLEYCRNCRPPSKIQSLNEKIWRTFNLAEVFSIRATSSGIDKNKIISGEKIFPYISRTDRNNGVQDFICEQPNYKRDEGNCITVGLDTQTAFYQPTTFYTGQNIQILRNDNLNFYVAQFVLPLLKKTLSIFSWGGNGATLTRLRRSKIQLPVNDEGAPDFEYMEVYIKNLEAEKYRKYLAYIGDD